MTSDTTKTDTNENKRGRPPGQQNRKYDVVEEHPATCPQCGSTRLTVVRGSSPQEMTYLGDKYDRVVWRLKQCVCGQYLKVRTYEKEWNYVQNKVGRDSI
jgi:hypothetical protein